MDDLDLSFTVQGCGLLSSKRRKSVCSSSIKRLQVRMIIGHVELLFSYKMRHYDYQSLLVLYYRQ